MPFMIGAGELGSSVKQPDSRVCLVSEVKDSRTSVCVAQVLGTVKATNAALGALCFHSG